MTGRWVTGIAPGSEEWLKTISASKVAAILGLSKWESPRSLWHQMRGDLPREEPTTAQSRGHYLEPAILAWFFDQHPELRQSAKTGASYVDGWKSAAPDAVAYRPELANTDQLC